MTGPDDRAARWDDRYRKVGPTEVS